jgi:hypothetical protein
MSLTNMKVIAFPITPPPLPSIPRSEDLATKTLKSWLAAIWEYTSGSDTALYMMKHIKKPIIAAI